MPTCQSKFAAGTIKLKVVCGHVQPFNCHCGCYSVLFKCNFGLLFTDCLRGNDKEREQSSDLCTVNVFHLYFMSSS